MKEFAANVIVSLDSIFVMYYCYWLQFCLISCNPSYALNVFATVCVWFMSLLEVVASHI